MGKGMGRGMGKGMEGRKRTELRFLFVDYGSNEMIGWFVCIDGGSVGGSVGWIMSLVVYPLVYPLVRMNNE